MGISDENVVIKMESFHDPLEFQNCENENNAWAVENVSVFLKYNCPECYFNDSNLQIFTNHALTNHKNATTLFCAENDVENPSVEVKMEIDQQCEICSFTECVCGNWNQILSNDL